MYNQNPHEYDVEIDGQRMYKPINRNDVIRHLFELEPFGCGDMDSCHSCPHFNTENCIDPIFASGEY